MRECPDVQFYAYTKQVRLFKAIIMGGAWQMQTILPYLYSFGGIHDKWIDINLNRHAAIFEVRKHCCGRLL